RHDPGAERLHKDIGDEERKLDAWCECGPGGDGRQPRHVHADHKGIMAGADFKAAACNEAGLMAMADDEFSQTLAYHHDDAKQWPPAIRYMRSKRPMPTENPGPSAVMRCRPEALFCNARSRTASTVTADMLP